ncbi:MAG: T9SS type A sorting domain-containing protein [Cyclobacteriaceae bacterium]
MYKLKITIVLFCCAMLPIVVTAATITLTSSGLWTDASTWPGENQPTANDDVIVPEGVTLKLVGSCSAKSITVHGTLNAVNTQAADAWIDLETESIMVASGGKLEIGTESQPYHATERCVITLRGNKIDNAVPAYKGIVVMDRGTLELHGKKRKSWTNIATTADAGASQITLKEAVEWEVGDIIALTSTDLAIKTNNNQKGAWENVDESEITGISEDKKTLTLKSPLKYKHVGGSKSYTRDTDGKIWDVDIFGEVGLLSHYIKIQGAMDGTNEQDGYGGHIMVMKGSTAHVEHVELYKMGQKAVLARYPFHWHLNEDQAAGSYLKNSSIHKSFNRAVTIHGTDYVTVDGVFAYDHIGHGIFLEDGGERFNSIKNNVVFVTRRPKQGEQLTPSDNFSDDPPLGDAPQNRTPASFWITNPNNYFENNVAAGTEGTGFWFAFPQSPMQFSGDLAYFDGLNPSTQPLGKFEGFVAHTCMNGWDVFDQLNPDHSIKRNFGWNIDTPQQIKGGLFYGNDQAIYCGLGVGGQNEHTVFYDCAFSDNKTITMLAGNLTIENSLFNADTELGVFEGVREFFRFYDGPGRHIDCHFEGWDRPNAEMIKQVTGGGATENFNPSFRGTTKGFSEPFPFRFKALPNTIETRTRKIGQFFKDYDGGLTGKAQTTLIRDIPFLIDGHEYRHPSWKNAARSDYYFAGLFLAGINASGVQMSIVRSKPGTEEVCFYESGTPASGTYKFPMIVNEDFMYIYYFDKAPDNKSIQLVWYRGEQGDLGMACFKGLGKLGNFRVEGHQFNLPLLNSQADVENASDNAYFIDSGNGDVYLKLRNEGGANRVNIFFNWDSNGSFQGGALPCTTNDLDGLYALDSDGDARPDLVEKETCGLVNSASDLQFNFNKSDEEFQKVNFTASNVNSDVYWLVRADYTNDPYMIRDGLKFNGSEVPQIKVRTKSEAAGAFQFFWATANENTFSKSKSVTVHPRETNVFEELVFDLSGFNTWTGQTITKIRLDLPPDKDARRHTYIDYIHGPDGNQTFCEPLEISLTNPTKTQFYEGDDLGVAVSVDKGHTSNIQLYLNDVLIREVVEEPYHWGTLNANSSIDPELLDLPIGTFILKAVATDFHDETTIEKTKTITVGPAILNIENPSVDKEVVIYPNPADGFVNLSLGESWKSAMVEIYNPAGSKLLRKWVSGGENSLNITALRSGLYLVKISSEQMMETKKLQIK